MGAGNRKNDSSNGKDDGYATIPPDSIHSTITAEISNPTSNESSKKPITVPTINKQDEIKIAGWNGKEERKIKQSPQYENARKRKQLIIVETTVLATN